MESDFQESYTYMMCDGNNHLIYIGVTTNLERRVRHHRNRAFLGFSERYKGSKLVYYETYKHIAEALARVYQLKGAPNRLKYSLVEAFNPEWKDLSLEWLTSADTSR